MVTNPRSYNTGSDIPLRSNIDSLFTAYNKSYLITNTLTSGTGQIKFDRADSTAMYDKFYITYNDSTKHITTLEYQFKEPELTNDDDTTGAPPKYIMRKKILRVEFSSYRLDNFSPDSYNENNYIWFEEEECVPVEKFKGYKVYYSRSKL